MMVASDEIIDMVKRILQGIPVTDDSKALHVMEDVGPGGHFLAHDHTYERFKDAIWQPKLIDRQNFEGWQDAGSKTYRQRVNEKVIEILDREEAPLLEESMFAELKRICELADEKHKDEELDVDMFV
jgi:trimethylamine--corrinoid protein Co-methyltransferase